jgi:hypothetical protein
MSVLMGQSRNVLSMSYRVPCPVARIAAPGVLASVASLVPSS